MKRIVAGIITVVLLGTALWVNWRPGPPPGEASSATPEACIERMFTTAETGDVAGYLDCFTGEQRQRLDRELASTSREAFAASLIDAVKPLKGRAVFGNQPDQAATGRVTLTVDRVYTGRVDRQTYALVREGRTWRIDRIESPAPFQPEQPYGTPVY